MIACMTIVGSLVLLSIVYLSDTEKHSWEYFDRFTRKCEDCGRLEAAFLRDGRIVFDEVDDLGPM